MVSSSNSASAFEELRVALANRSGSVRALQRWQSLTQVLLRRWWSRWDVFWESRRRLINALNIVTDGIRRERMHEYERARALFTFVRRTKEYIEMTEAKFELRAALEEHPAW